MFNVRKNGFSFKACLSGCTEARKANPLLCPHSSLVSRRITQELSGLLTLCLKVGEPQLARAWGVPAQEVVRGAGDRDQQPGLHTGRGVLSCLGAQTQPKRLLKDRRLPDKHVRNFWVGVTSFPSLLYPFAVLG